MHLNIPFVTKQGQNLELWVYDITLLERGLFVVSKRRHRHSLSLEKSFPKHILQAKVI